MTAPGDIIYLACKVETHPDREGFLAVTWEPTGRTAYPSRELVVHRDDPKLARHRDDILASAALQSKIGGAS